MSIKNLFSEIPQTYELINHILTFGLDERWRKTAARMAAREGAPARGGGGRSGGSKWLDICCGTGQMASRLCEHADERTEVFAVDFCPAMLQRAVSKRKKGRPCLCASDIGALPFADDTFDLVTISFAARNINTSPEKLACYFRLIRRVIKPGGRFLCLETSQPESIILRKIFHAYIHIVVTPIGSLLSGSKKAYSYLSYTIPRFFGAWELSNLLRDAGFTKVSFSYMTFGLVAVHTAKKNNGAIPEGAILKSPRGRP